MLVRCGAALSAAETGLDGCGVDPGDLVAVLKDDEELACAVAGGEAQLSGEENCADYVARLCVDDGEGGLDGLIGGVQ